LRHEEVPIFADIARISRVCDGHRLAFDVRSKAFTRDSGVQAARSDAPSGSTEQVRRCRIGLQSILRGKLDMPEAPTFGRYAKIPYDEMTPEQQEAIAIWSSPAARPAG